MSIENLEKQQLHAVVVSVPSHGHVTPCMQLAKKLVSLHNFRITFVSTTQVREKSRSTDDHGGIDFVTVSDGLPEDRPRHRDVNAFIQATVEMVPAFEELITNLLKKSAITCVIHDSAFTSPARAAQKFGIPVAHFGTAAVISSHCYYNLDTFIAAGVLPIPPPPISKAALNAPLTCLPGASHAMRVKDIPLAVLTHDLETFLIRFFRSHSNPLLREADCVLYNTSSDLEGEVLNAMRGSMNSNVFAVGPLVLDAQDVDGVEEVTMAGVGSELREEDPVSLSWLDKQKPRSVLFVSFGSVATVPVQQMREFAAGLEASNVAFLWVVRADLIDEASENVEYKSMFAEFAKRTEKRALLVPWAPQAAVLAHPAVGAFLTHCGWNSTIESISCGVPMLGRPGFPEQNTTCHYVTSVWKIGLELRQSQADDGAQIVGKDEIAAKVKKIMSEDATDKEVVEIRRNCKNVQVAARKAVSTGGSSRVALAQFVEFIASRTKAVPLSQRS